MSLVDTAPIILFSSSYTTKPVTENSSSSERTKICPSVSPRWKNPVPERNDRPQRIRLSDDKLESFHCHSMAGIWPANERNVRRLIRLEKKHRTMKRNDVEGMD